MVAGVVGPGGRCVVGHGKLAAGDARVPDGETIFEIGSVTKVFTSLALADMVNRGAVALEDPAGKYLPEGVRMPERGGRAITLHDLATHRSGLPPMPGNLNLDPRSTSDEYGVKELYQFLAGYALPREPGSEYEYSNLGAGLLGVLLANRAGTDYERLIRDRITRPLGMPDTVITLSASMRQRMATGHNGMLGAVANSDVSAPLAGAGALRASVNDMLALLEACLGYRETSLASAISGMLAAPRPAGQMEIGLGWLVMSSHGKKIVGHNGATGGFRSFAGYDPAERVGVVVLSNACTAGGVDDIGFHLLNPKAPLADFAAPQPRTEISVNPEILAGYTGRYQVMPNLVFEITRDGARLFAQGFAQLPHKQPGELTALPQFELFAESEKKFFARVADNQFSFETDPAGRAIGLVLHRGGRDSHGPRLL